MTQNLSLYLFRSEASLVHNIVPLDPHLLDDEDVLTSYDPLNATLPPFCDGAEPLLATGSPKKAPRKQGTPRKRRKRGAESSDAMSEAVNTTR